MGQSTLTCIIPTIGRTTLKRAVDSVLPQLEEQDELIVVADGPIELHCGPLPDSPILRYFELPERINDMGSTPINYALARAKGDFVWFLADDDACDPQGVASIRARVSEQPHKPHLFSMMHGKRNLSGSTNAGNVSGQQIVVPRIGCPPMGNEEPADYLFIQACVQKWGEVVKHTEIIAHLDCQRQGRMA